MASSIGSDAALQLDHAVDVVGGVLGHSVLGAYVYGSAVGGGLRPRSDLDVLVVSSRSTTLAEKRTLIEGFTCISGLRAATGPARSLEVSIVVQSDVRPWRYPPPLDFQYGDWFRSDYERGNFTPWGSPNPDVAVLLTTVFAASETLFGPPAGDLLDTVPRQDLDRAMLDGIAGLLAEIEDDTANVMLTLARIWTTLATGEIRPKDVAADWALARLPDGHRAVLARARAVYLGDEPDTWDDLRPLVERDAQVVVAEIERVERVSASR